MNRRHFFKAVAVVAISPKVLALPSVKPTANEYFVHWQLIRQLPWGDSIYALGRTNLRSWHPQQERFVENCKYLASTGTPQILKFILKDQDDEFCGKAVYFFGEQHSELSRNYSFPIIKS